MVILGGAAGEPLSEQDDRTPLEAAVTPTLDRLARSGRIGAVAATPADMQPEAGVCRLSLLGSDPRREYPGRAALDALGAGVELGEGQWALRVDLACAGEPGTEEDGVLLGMPRGLSAQEAGQLIRDAVGRVRETEPALMERVRLVALPQSDAGALLIDDSGRDYADVETVSPEVIVDQAWEDWMPASGRRGASAAEAVVRLMEVASQALERHPINAARQAAGLPAANLAWIWGAARSASPASFAEHRGVSAAMLAGSALSAGLGRLLGMASEPWSREAAAGASADALHDRLRQVDFLCIVPEIGSLGENDAAERLAAIEAADAKIIRPLAEALERFGDAEQDERAEGWRLLVVADRFLTSGGADPTPTPLLMAGSWIRSVVARRFNERDAIASDLAIEPGHELMEYFLRGGMADRRPRPRPE